MDIETAKSGKSTCRNEAIAEAFHYMHIVEAWGTGLPRIINRCKEYGLSSPLFEEFGNSFKVTIYRKVSNAPKKISNTFKKYISILKKAEVSDVYINNIELLFAHCGVDTIFGQANVMEWLHCSKSKATNFNSIPLSHMYAAFYQNHLHHN